MTASRVFTAGSAIVGLLLLAGCAPSGGQLTVAFEFEGVARSITVRPAEVVCDDLGISANALGDSVGVFTILRTENGRPASAQGSVTDGTLYAVFESDDLEVDLSDGRVSVLEAEVSIAALEGAADSPPDFSAGDPVETTGTLTAELTCAS